MNATGHHTFRIFTTLLSLTTLTHHPVVAGDAGREKGKQLEKITTNDHYRSFLINNVFNYYGNNGDGSYNIYSGYNGFEFPKGGGKKTTFEDGIIWAGFHKGRVIPKVGGSDYRHALQAGKILTHGTATTDPVADDPASAKYRLYRVRPDVNPSTPFDAAMKARLEAEEVLYIGRYESYTANDIYNQYIQDWNEWPAADGAPFKDVKGNGVYDPSVDVPGVPGADQTLWYVANDLDPGRVYNLAGCPPIGLEMQKTIWGYKRSGVLGNTIFARTRIINKSGASIDSMYIGQGADPDLGDAEDDYVGCDTTRDLGFVYNAAMTDLVYGYAVPSCGFVLLQGPIVPGQPTDTALFGTKLRPGYRNLRMTSFNFILHSHGPYGDPDLGPGGDIQRYNLLNGFTRYGSAFINPLTGQVTKYPFSGDPSTGSGWNDGSSFLFPFYDYRLLVSCGPLTMADGDTQEVVVAHLAAQSYDRLSSVTLLKQYVDFIRSTYPDLMLSVPPEVRVNAQFSTTSDASISVLADGRGLGAKSIVALLNVKDGSTVSQLQLFDDGAHGDGAANDGIFANTGTIPRQRDAMSLTAIVTDQQNRTRTWEGIVEGIVTAGSLIVGGPVIFSDNINNDGRANPGENIRYGFAIRNNTSFTFADLVVVAGWANHRVASISAGGAYSMVYNPGDPQSYFSFDCPRTPLYQIPVSMYDGSGNFWSDTVAFTISPLLYKLTRDTLKHVSGLSTGDFQLLIVDPVQFRSHLYAISGVDSINAAGDAGFTLKDSTGGRVLLLNHPLPDEWGHNTPVTDGFKVVQGTIHVHSGMYGWDFSPGWPRLWELGEVTNVLSLEGFWGTIGNAHDHWYSGGVGPRRQHSVLLKFAGVDTNGVLLNPSDTLASFAYRYLRNASAPPAQPAFTPFIKNATAGYAYQDYTRTLPFAVHDVDTTPPKRLMVGYLENNVPDGFVDGKYWPPTPLLTSSIRDNGVESGPREWFFIFDMPYRETPDPLLQVDIYNNHVPMMWVGYPARAADGGINAGGEFSIIAGHAPGSSDLWTFVLNHDDYLPASYALFQNYPNPFNPSTTIRYTLPVPSNVNLTIYNILGQRVKTLVNGPRYAGETSVQWDGTNDAGLRIASGVYFYRLGAFGLNDPHQATMETKKMLLVR